MVIAVVVVVVVVMVVGGHDIGHRACREVPRSSRLWVWAGRGKIKLNRRTPVLCICLPLVTIAIKGIFTAFLLPYLSPYVELGNY